MISPIMLALENRIKFAILVNGGFVWKFNSLQPVLRDADNPINFAPRVRCPLLMINGEQDSSIPFKTCQEPMFEMLGSTDKKHEKYPGGHSLLSILLNTGAREDILKWMNDPNHLGPVD